FANPPDWADNDFLSHLPVDVFDEILSYLNRIELLNVRRVSQKMLRYADQRIPKSRKISAENLIITKMASNSKWRKNPTLITCGVMMTRQLIALD
ncbi:hypothetical protein PFISCL1PPCAC_18236, partial [Pristionchus fissidentatus]